MLWLAAQDGMEEGEFDDGLRGSGFEAGVFDEGEAEEEEYQSNWK